MTALIVLALTVVMVVFMSWQCVVVWREVREVRRDLRARRGTR